MTRAHGAGRITLVGTVPGRDLASRLMRWLVPVTSAGWDDLPPSVTVSTSTRPDARRLHVLHNWSWEPVDVAVPAALDVLAAPRGDALADPPPTPAAGAVRLEGGDVVRLGAWDVLVALGI